MTSMLAHPSDPLERYRAIHATRMAEQEAQIQGEQQRKAAEAAAQREADRQRIVALAEHLLGPALVGWEIVTTAESWDSRRWEIRRTFGEDTVCIRCKCEYDGGMRGKLNRLNFHTLVGQHISSDWWLNFEQPDHDGAEAAIAMVCVPALDRRRQQREYEAKLASERAAEAERKERAAARLAELVAEAEDHLTAIETDLLARYGWPDRGDGVPLPLRAWKLEWVMGVSADGDETRQEEWSILGRPGPDGFYRVLDRTGIKRLQITTPNAILAREVIWLSAGDLPYGLRQKVRLSRYCQAVTRRGETSVEGPARYVDRELMVPGATIRQVLGLPTDEIRDDRDDLVEDLDGEVVVREDVEGEDDIRDRPW